ncbi:MAG: DUF58 domain-containing protein [Gammaproteobacteria bacterium]|nr:DUF58 domain-containing protein [Gammaproteobacteria bacterium]
MPSLTGAYVTVADLIGLATAPIAKRRTRRATGGHSGTLVSRMRGRGVDLDEVRLYQAGDDVRNIDWKVTARKEKPHTKIFREERERPTMLVIDQRRSMFFGSQVRLKSVAAAEVAARIAWQTLNARDRVGGVVIEESSLRILKPIRSKLNVVRLLSTIADANNRLSTANVTLNPEGSSWHAVLMNLRRATPVGHRIVFVSDFQEIEESDLRQLLVLQNHNEISLIHVYDPVEQNLPPSGAYAVTDGFQRVTFSGGNQRNQRRYEERFEAHRSRLQDACRTRGIRFVSLSTVDDVSQVTSDE